MGRRLFIDLKLNSPFNSAMVWLWLLNGQYGLANRMLAWVGITGPNWLTDRDWVMPSLVLIGLWGIGQSVLVYSAALKEIPRSLYEAASLDGMRPGRQFLHITLPMLSPMILFNVILSHPENNDNLANFVIFEQLP